MPLAAGFSDGVVVRFPHFILPFIVGHGHHRGHSGGRLHSWDCGVCLRCGGTLTIIRIIPSLLQGRQEGFAPDTKY